VFIDSDEALRKERMIKRGDRNDKIDQRLMVDRKYFNKDKFFKINLNIRNDQEPLDTIALSNHLSKNIQQLLSFPYSFPFRAFI